MIKISGHSDDVINVEGDITEEFYISDVEEASSYLAFSDGSVLGVQYDKDGIWRINRIIAGSAAYSKVEGTDDVPSGERSENYGTDIVTLDAEIAWVLGGEVFARRKAVS